MPDQIDFQTHCKIDHSVHSQQQHWFILNIGIGDILLIDKKKVNSNENARIVYTKMATIVDG